MTDIAAIIQAELARLNHSIEPFANYGRHVAAVLSRLAAPSTGEIARLIERLDVIADGADIREDQQAELHKAAAALRSLVQELERTKDDLRRVQSVYDFAKLSAERDSLAQEVERLKVIVRSASSLRDKAIAALGQIVQDDYRNLVTATKAERAAIRTETIEECKKAIVNVRFGPPSNWGGDRPRGWHLDRPCAPKEASHHDNGCNDAFRAVSALATASAAES